MVVESEQANPAGPMPISDMRRVLSGHVPALDGIRGASIAAVLMCHLTWIPFGLPGHAGRFVREFVLVGWVGVSSFFVLSGFLITGILLDSKGSVNYFSSFYARRALRILPLYYAALFAGFILFPLLGKSGVPFFPARLSSGQLWYWFYAGNYAWLRGQVTPYFDHFWSLAVEEQFYLLWPLIILVTMRRSLAKACIGLIAFAPVLRIVLYLKGVNGDGIFHLTTSHVDALGLGALAAIVVRDEAWLRRLAPHLRYFIYPSLAAFCLLCVGTGSWNSEGLAFICGASMIAIFVAAVLLRAMISAGQASALQWLLGMGWLRSWGKYSYAIYVLHFPFVYFYFGTVMPRLMLYLRNTGWRMWFHHRTMMDDALLVTVYIAHQVVLCLIFWGLGKLSWWAFEGRINGLKKHFKPRWRVEPVAVPPVAMPAE